MCDGVQGSKESDNPTDISGTAQYGMVISGTNLDKSNSSPDKNSAVWF